MSEFLFPFIAGWIAGAIINYFSDTLPTNRRLNKPFCLVCGTKIGLANYFFWPRRCDHCGHSRPWRVWIVELFLTIASIWLWKNAPAGLGYWTGIGLLAYFILITVIDLEHRLILNITSLAGLLFGLWVGSNSTGLYQLWRAEQLALP
jgi:prepilin signal peptidase PulO-like enzyme (type II secretory pathway)